jgi:hypothetical protein
MADPTRTLDSKDARHLLSSSHIQLTYRADPEMFNLPFGVGSFADLRGSWESL